MGVAVGLRKVASFFTADYRDGTDADSSLSSKSVVTLVFATRKSDFINRKSQIVSSITVTSGRDKNAASQAGWYRASEPVNWKAWWWHKAAKGGPG